MFLIETESGKLRRWNLSRFILAKSRHYLSSVITLSPYESDRAPGELTTFFFKVLSFHYLPIQTGALGKLTMSSSEATLLLLCGKSRILCSLETHVECVTSALLLAIISKSSPKKTYAVCICSFFFQQSFYFSN